MATAMKPQGMKLQKHDTEIDKNDQAKICQFSRANMRASDLKDEIKKLKEEVDNLEDAALLVEESMGEGLSLFLGECFVTCGEEQGTNYVEQVMAEKNEELEKKNEMLDKLQEEMKQLKTHLYARFGSSINLEENPE